MWRHHRVERDTTVTNATTIGLSEYTTEDTIENGSADYKWSRWIMQMQRERDALRAERIAAARDARLFIYD